VLASALLYAFSRLGQRLAAEQMDTLHAAVELALAARGKVFPGPGPS
jgi:hypothetical protein